ncbi:MAG: aminomethyl-transferring glycine dehydrogenase subunit GcvPA [Candidatus Latescibacterota bacterium]|nr:MAG: aminomethyl-transferring glycine dehydrogenase subunit GcvPA [Candidatus Latescibacterota bacterium]
MSYIQNTDADRAEMLEAIGVRSFDELLEPIPEALRMKGDLALDPPLAEAALAAHLGALAGRNRPAAGAASFLGGGIYDRHIPALVRYVASRSEFYTSYTPYQAEVSQGTLQAIYEYQSLVCRVTGMDVANASMYDGATALAEAMLMVVAIKGAPRVLVPRALSPRYRAVLASYAAARDIAVVEIPYAADGLLDGARLESSLGEKTAALVVAQPNYFGVVENAGELAALAHAKGAAVIACVDPVSCALIAPPGEYGADVAVGEGQSLGLPQSYGGPLLGFMATRKEHVRRMPGRLVSGTVDIDGKRGYVMTLQTREQHIRREKATSNICTNEALCALSAAVYLAALGEKGFREVAEQSYAKSHALAGMLAGVRGARLPFGGPFFQEFVLELPTAAAAFATRASAAGILPGIPLGADFPELGERAILVAVTEKRTRSELERYRDLLAGKEAGR